MLRRTLLARGITSIMTAQEAVNDIPSGAIIAFGGFGPCGMSFECFKALGKTDAKDLTLVGILMGAPELGTGLLAKQKKIKKAITTYVNYNKPLTDSLFRGEFEIEFSPMGNLVDRVRAGGNGMLGFYTATGYGTNVSEGGLPVRWSADGSGRIEKFSEPKETRCLNGKWCVFEEALPVDYAFVKAWKADKRGNVIFHQTARNFNLSVARAARKATIVEVEEIVENGELDPDSVHLPCVYVDRLVLEPKPDKYFCVPRMRERETGAAKAAPTAADLVRDHIARRAALEVTDGMKINLGVGMPNLVAKFMPSDRNVLLQGENGVLGLGPPPYPEDAQFDFTNAGMQPATGVIGHCFFDTEESFCMIRGGHMDLTMLGALQVSGSGDLASWYVPGKILSGPGGAMDLTVSCPKRIALMEHTTKDGASRVVDRCTIPLTAKSGLDMLITELATFEFHTNKAAGITKMTLTELAEGVTLDDVKAKTLARFDVAVNIKTQPLAPIL